MRELKLIATLLAILLTSCAPALAESPNAAAQQYSDPRPQAAEVRDIIRAATKAAARGTGALNGALSSGKSSAEAATLSGGNASDPVDPPDSEGKVAGMTMLPATGGPSPLLPCAGALLVVAGVARLARRAAH